jgi:hypothetical protein
MKKKRKIMNYKVSNTFLRHLLLFYISIEQRESLEEENRQVHNTNTYTITRLQELENSSSQLQVTKTPTYFLI